MSVHINQVADQNHPLPEGAVKPLKAFHDHANAQTEGGRLTRQGHEQVITSEGEAAPGTVQDAREAAAPPQTQEAYTGYLTRQQLSERGWTSRYIDRFLGRADERRPDPRNPDGHLKLFRLHRAVRAEAWRRKSAAYEGRLKELSQKFLRPYNWGSAYDKLTRLLNNPKSLHSLRADLRRLPETIQEHYCGAREAKRGREVAKRNGWNVKVILNANGCCGCFARTDAIVTRPLTEAEKGSALKARRELLRFLREIGWKGRKLAKAAVQNARCPWHVAPTVVQALLGGVPPHNSPKGPLLAACLDHLLSEDKQAKAA